MNRRPWTDQQRDLLRRLWNPSINADPAALNWKAIEAISKKLYRPSGAIYQQARSLGLLGEKSRRHGNGARAVREARALNRLPPEHRNGLLSAASEPSSRVPPLTDFLGQKYDPPRLQQAGEQR